MDATIHPSSKILLKNRWQKITWPDFTLVIILALLPALFFWRLITPNPVDRMDIAAGDFTEQYFPLRAFVAQEWVRGHIPLWNPYLYGGQPALADIQSGALYPPHVLEALLLGWGGPLVGQEIGFPLWALELQVIAHFTLAAVGAYLFARHEGLRNRVRLRRARFGAVITSLVFTYSGYLTGFPVQQITILAVSAWLPWVLWGLSAALPDETKRQRGIQAVTPVLWGALAFALAILAGHPQTVLYIFYISLAYTIFRALSGTVGQRASEAVRQRSREVGSEQAREIEAKGWPHLLTLSPLHPLISSLLRSLALWLIITAGGGCLAAAQLLPTLEFITYSLRADLSYKAVAAGLPLTEFISILYPGFLGGSPEYAGIAGLVFIGLALVLAQPRRDIFFWAGAGLMSLLLAFGGNTFLYPLFYLLTPGFEVVRQQERAFLIYSFSAAMLAGYGAIVLTGPLSRLTRSSYLQFERRLRWVAGIAAGMTAFFIYGSAAATARGDEVNLFFGVLWHHLFGLMTLAGMLLLLAIRSRRWLRREWGMGLVAGWLIFNLFTVNWRFNLEKPVNPEPFTADAVTQFLQTNLPPAHPPLSQAAAPPLGRIVSGGLLPGGHSGASVYNLQDLTGNTPLQLATVNNFLQQMPAWRAWQLLNVRYVVEQRDVAGPGLSLVFEADERKVFRMEDPFPRAWFVSQTEVIAEVDAALARLAAADFDLRTTAIVPEPLRTPLAQASTSTVNIVDFSSGRLKVEVNTSESQLLVLSQIYYPGWQVMIDGQPAGLWQVNVILQGVLVPAGSRTVQLIFSPATFWLGLGISGVTLLAWIILVGWAYLIPLRDPFFPLSTLVIGK